MAFDLVNIVFFIACGIWQQNIDVKDSIHNWIETWYILAVISFLMTVVFYLLTVFMDPGYVPTKTDFLALLQKIKSDELHLDYVCVYCETLRPENSGHCNFCNRCVQKFDHHCVFVNNCLGYRNHKWFICLLFSFTFFMVVLFCHSIFAFLTLSVAFNTSENKAATGFKIFVAIWFIFVVLLHLPVVYLQLQS